MLNLSNLSHFEERIDFHYLVSKCFVGDWCQFTVLRQKKQSLCSLQLEIASALEALAKLTAMGGLPPLPFDRNVYME